MISTVSDTQCRECTEPRLGLSLLCHHHTLMARETFLATCRRDAEHRDLTFSRLWSDAQFAGTRAAADRKGKTAGSGFLQFQDEVPISDFVAWLVNRGVEGMFNVIEPVSQHSVIRVPIWSITNLSGQLAYINAVCLYLNERLPGLDPLHKVDVWGNAAELRQGRAKA